MTDLKEKIELLVRQICKDGGKDCSPQFHNSCPDKMKLCKYSYDLAAQFLACAKEAGYVQLNPDQSLPELNELRGGIEKGYAHKMYLQGWRRVMEVK